MTILESLPALAIALDGTELDDELLSLLARAEVDQRVNAPAACELEFSDPRGSAADHLRAGAIIVVRAGPERRTIFSGAVAAVELEVRSEYVRSLRVLAYDALDVLRRGTPVRVHSDVTFADLASELTKPLGIAVDFDEPGSLRSRIVQHRRSDFDVLLDAAERAARYVRLDGARLRSYPIAPGGEARTFAVGAELRELRVRLSSVDAASSVDVHGWDPRAVRAVHGNATGSGDGAADVKLTNVILNSDGQADVVARSQLERRGAASAVLDAVAEGDAALAPGVCVRLSGVPPAYEGPFRITRARHVLSTELGYVVDISSAPPPPHPPPQAASATLGVVADVRDPESLGRLKVRYPALDDAESDWLQMLAAGAGGKKGLVALPATGDLVLVLGVDHDPAHGIVLGALYGSGGLPGERARSFKGYALYSPGGHTIELDDDGALLLRTIGGTKLELGRDRSTLHSETDLRIEAPGKTLTIAADKVEIEKA